MITTAMTALMDSGQPVTAAGLAHRVYRPARVGPHPTLIMLHGRGGDENAMWLFARTLPESDGWLLIAPRAPLPDPDGGYSWHPRIHGGLPLLEVFDDAVAAVLRLARAVPGLYDADADRLYLMGFSQGAATAFATALRHPHVAEGIVGLMGFAPADIEAALPSTLLSGLPIFLAAGRRDTLVPLEVVQATARTLQAAGARLEFHEYDTGHKVTAIGLQDLRRWWRATTVGAGAAAR